MGSTRLADAATRSRPLKTEPDPLDLLSMQDVSDLTGIPLGTLRHYRHTGKGGPRCGKVGSRIYYRRADVEAWVNEHFAATGGDDHAA